MRKLSVFAAVAGGLLSGAGLPAHAAVPSFTGLGGLGGSPYPNFLTDGLGVSADGSTVVGYVATADGVEAFRWTAAGGMVSLGDLPGGIVEGGAYDASGDGSVIVGQGVNAADQEAFRWTAAGGMVGLGALPGSTSSIARGVSEDGNVVVGESVKPPGGQAFRWTAATGMVGLGYLPGGAADPSGAAHAASVDGSVLVGASSSASGAQAFRWTAAGGMVGLGYLDGTSRSEATDVTPDGSVAVGTAGSDGGVSQAFRWTAGGGMVGLDELPGGLALSEAWGVNADGSVVVGSSHDDAEQQAVVWDAAGVHTLAELLGDAGVDLTGWRLDLATGVSADGTIVVGSGTHNGALEAFVAVIPEPGTAGILLVAAGLRRFARCRRRA